MFNLEQLLQKNHEISELSRVLSYLIEDRLICDTEITCNLFYDYIDRVNNHIDFGNHHFYQDLLVHHQPSVQNTARNFMNGSTEIKRVFKQYIHKWCNLRTNPLQLKFKDHGTFIKETNEMFDLVLNRIQDEQEKLYPVLRSIWALEQAA
jgi:hypothetical protein